MEAPPLDPSQYRLQGKELAFFQDHTGIHDEDELRNHIMKVQAEAYAIRRYPCIRRFAFLRMLISKHSIYGNVLEIGRDRPNAILLDLGCCFGNDVRRAVADGYPRENIIASDIEPEFWTLGHKLFKSTPESFPVPFVSGDIFDPNFLAQNVKPAPSSSTPSSPPPLKGVTSLIQLQHHISVIHLSCFFHLFNEEKQQALAHLLGSLLSPASGSIIFGIHVGAPAGAVSQEEKPYPGAVVPFLHTPLTWENMWISEGAVFRPEDVNLSTMVRILEPEVVAAGGFNPTVTRFLLEWSVIRV